MEENMATEERKDVLIEFLADLYEIETGETGTNPVLDRKIRIMEKRLEMLGVTGLSAIK